MTRVAQVLCQITFFEQLQPPAVVGPARGAQVERGWGVWETGSTGRRRTAPRPFPQVHLLHMVHRDLSPDNFLVDKQSMVVKLCDFNEACSIYHPRNKLCFNSDDEEARQAVSVYGAPELYALVNSDVDYRADLYSLGMVLYHLLMGRPPFLQACPCPWLMPRLSIILKLRSCEKHDPGLCGRCNEKTTC